MDAALTGHLTDDPKVSVYDGGKTKVTARVAMNDSYVNRDGERVECEPLFFTVEWWGDRARAFAQEAAKVGAATGRKPLVMVQGRWRADTWRTEQGEDRRRQYVLADAMAVVVAPAPDAPAEGMHP